MSEKVVPFTMSDVQTLTVLWREIHQRAERMGMIYARNGNADGIALARDVKMRAADSIRGLEKGGWR